MGGRLCQSPPDGALGLFLFRCGVLVERSQDEGGVPGGLADFRRGDNLLAKLLAEAVPSFAVDDEDVAIVRGLFGGCFLSGILLCGGQGQGGQQTRRKQCDIECFLPVKGKVRV